MLDCQGDVSDTLFGPSRFIPVGHEPGCPAEAKV